MIETFQKIWQFAGDEKKNINKSVWVSFASAILQMFQIGAIYLVVLDLTGGAQGGRTAWLALACELISIFGGAVMSSNSKMYQTHAGYFMAADRRIAIADRMKSVPMGFFNANSLGQVSGVCTTVVGTIETMVPMVLVNILSGLITTLVFTVLILAWDWRIGLIALAGIFLYLAVVSAMEKKSAAIAEDTQKSQTALIEAVLETIQGMSVIKSFNLTGKGDQKLQDALEYNRKSNLGVEQVMTPYTAAQEAILQITSVAMMLAAICFWTRGTMSLPNALMTPVVSFLVFSQVKLFGMGVSMLRLAGAAIDRTVETEQMPQMDEQGKPVDPEKHDIVFDHVSFSYEKKPILRGVTVTLPDKTTTAIIGPSGSGKTTFCNLVARFWDVDSGSEKIGGTDVRDYTLESLMDQISMVFQNVYLFADTMENNIKFGCPNATHEQVVEAAKKACCDDFIQALPDGYNTVIGEGGASLSGGEKQRISIARAMLKDAPIIILDEATANVDPENEDRLQKAIEALTRNKTILMIAHRLKTVRSADQILVLDGGKIVQHGRHEELIRQPGIYADFVGGKKETAGWKL
ncbi:MAG: ABC transporter ATP-binding protein [Clostridiales bacterium]|nr:ABC transporter ATP-binding protein [Clostridiales bacterium]